MIVKTGGARKMFNKNKCCWCLERRKSAYLVAILSLLVLAGQVANEVYKYERSNKEHTVANFTVTMLGLGLQLFVTGMLLCGINWNRVGFFWPYMVWVSLTMGLAIFQCLVLLFVKPVDEIKYDMVVTVTTIVILYYFVFVIQEYEDELRKELELRRPSTAATVGGSEAGGEGGEQLLAVTTEPTR
ncbi:uncharacterized protein LOC108677240 [Hyalella azteca]|uniref:Uncharacterized protein LOC108677240 n=1 Tax=Hyalella azteca TaxID=294128 RepID=A0A8B7P732_HYAAZ|nr:uncharacterized protein LOC108677240 [Hyalella azteca]